MSKASHSAFVLVPCLFLVSVGSIFAFQYLFGGQPPFSKEVIYFSSPDSKAAFAKISELSNLEIKKRLEGFADPGTNLLQNILSLLPAQISVNPGYLFICNAILHTVCGFLVFTILQTETSTKAGWVGASIFTLNPTCLEWTANLLKDGIFITGCLLCIFSIYRLIDTPCQSKIPKIAQSMGLWCIGLFLIYKSRFYFLELCAVFGLLALGNYIFEFLREFDANLFQKKRRNVFVPIVTFFVFLVLTPIWLGLQGRELCGQDSNFLPIAFSKGHPRSHDSKNPEALTAESISNKSVSHTIFINDIKWKPSTKVPEFIENKLFVLSVRRQGFLNSAGHSKVDEDIKIQSTFEFICYFPKAFVNGRFSPFPGSWFQKGSSEVHSLGRKILGFFTLLYWPLLLAAACYFLQNLRNKMALTLCVFSMVGVLFFSYLVPNIGALNRLRYGFYMLWIAVGAAYLTAIVERRPFGKKTAEPN